MSGQILDLYGVVGLELDRSSWAKAERRVHRFAQDMQRRLDSVDFGKRMAGVGQAFKRVGQIGAAGIGAGFIAGAKDALDFESALTDLDISSRGAVGKLAAVRSQVLKVSNATGVARDDVLAGAQAFVTLTGDGDTAAKSMAAFARVARGQKASMEDVAGAAATMAEQFGIAGPQFEQAFSILSAGGKAGKVELRDIAGLMAELGASFKPFGASQGVEGLATLGAAFQIAAKNFGSASEAATGLEALMGSLQQNAAKLSKAKVNIFEADGKTMKPMLEIVDALTSKGFTETKLFDLLGRKEAITTLRALRDNRRAVDEIRVATLAANDVQVDFDRRMQSSAARAENSLNRFKNKIADAFTPKRLEKFAGWLETIGSKLEANVEFLEMMGETAAGVFDVMTSNIDADTVTGVANVFKPEARRKLQTARDELEAKGSIGGSASVFKGDIARLLDRGIAEMSYKPTTASIPKGAAGGGSPAGGKTGTVNVNAAPTITINAGNADAQQVGQVVKKEVMGWWTQKLREAVVGAGT